MGWFDWVGSKPKKRPEDQRADEIMPAIDDLYQDHREQHGSSQPQSHDQHAHEERDREADEHAMHHPHQRHHADGFNAEGWRGIRDGVRGNGAPNASKRSTDQGEAQNNLRDDTDGANPVNWLDQIRGVAEDRVPAPGVEPDGGHKRRR
jgi:hypothetical protein